MASNALSETSTLYLDFFYFFEDSCLDIKISVFAVDIEIYSCVPKVCFTVPPFGFGLNDTKPVPEPVLTVCLIGLLRAPVKKKSKHFLCRS